MASPTPPKSAGKKPARSDAEWWDKRRLTAFEMVRDGRPSREVCASLAIGATALKQWQRSPRWQARLAERDAAVVAATQALELGPLEKLAQKQNDLIDWLLHLAEKGDDKDRPRLGAIRDALNRLRIQKPEEPPDASAAAGQAFAEFYKWLDVARRPQERKSDDQQEQG